MSMLSWLFNAEVPNPPKWMTPFFNTYVILFAILYPIGFMSSAHFLFTGPGLGEDFTYQHVINFIELLFGWSSIHDHLFSFIFFIAALVLNLGFGSYLIIHSYFIYQSTMGKEYPKRDLITFGLFNLLNLLFPIIFLISLGALVTLFGVDYTIGVNLLSNIVTSAHNIISNIPTLFIMPGWMAFFCTLMTWGLIHYWAHRLSHTRRFLWLVIHRPHHMPPDLHYTTTLPVFMAFPFFLLIAFPYLFIFGATAKIFSSEPVYYEFILFNIFTFVGQIIAHSPNLYEKYRDKTWAKIASLYYTIGLYHILHHSAEPQSARISSNNTVNFGSAPFALYDIIFGTFEPLPKKLPAIGLHGSPELVRNPLRLLTAGIFQICYELWHNPKLSDRFKIIFGPSTYTPTISKSFIIK
jgi:sterol desaturase/sphingolipid hydroxylase (fatty acid hydroxylase superfamily)